MRTAHSVTLYAQHFVQLVCDQMTPQSLAYIAWRSIDGME
jgi:hypothetical protein